MARCVPQGAVAAIALMLTRGSHGQQCRACWYGGLCFLQCDGTITLDPDCGVGANACHPTPSLPFSPPSTSPSASPTQVPTEAPSIAAPTFPPTRTPTHAPTSSPMRAPTTPPILPPTLSGSPAWAPSVQYVTSQIAVPTPLTSGNLRSNWKYSSATFVPSVNKVFAAPFIRPSSGSLNAAAASCAVLLVDGVTNTASASVRIQSGSAYTQWSGMDFAPNVNKLFAAPYSAGAVLVVDPMTNSTDATSLAVLNSNTVSNNIGMWSDIAFAPVVGKLFAAPFNADSILIVDPVSNTTDTTTLAGLGSGGSKWAGIIFVPTVNKLFAAPSSSNSVLIVDPIANTTDTTTLRGLGIGDGKWSGIVFVPTVNKLFAAPYNSNSVLIVDPVSNTTDTTTLRRLSGSAAKWSAIVFVPTVNKLFAAPFDASSILIVDPEANATDTTILSGFGSGGDKWGGIAFDSLQNKVFATPYTADTVLVIEFPGFTSMVPTSTPTPQPTTPTPTLFPTHSPTTTSSPTQCPTPSPSHEVATVTLSSASTSSALTTEHATRQRVDPSPPPPPAVATRGPESTAGTPASQPPSPSSNSSGTTSSSSSSSSSADSIVYIIVVLLLIIMLVCGVIVWQRRKHRDKNNARLSQRSGGDGVAKDMAVNPMFYTPSMLTDDDAAPVPSPATATDYRSPADIRSPSRNPRPATVFIQQPHSELQQAATSANDASATHRPAWVAASQTSRPTTIYANPLPCRPPALPTPGEYGELGAPAGGSSGTVDYESLDNDASVYAQLDRSSTASAVALPPPGEYATVNVGAAHTRAKPQPLSIAQDNGGPGVYSHVDRFQPRMMSPRLSAPGPGEVFFAVPLEGTTDRVMVLGTKDEGEFC